MLHVHDLYRLLDIEVDGLASYSGETFNVGGGLERSVSLQELTSLCQKYTGKSVPINRIGEDRAGDIRIYITDNGKVIKKTGWKPEISVERTIEEIAGWIKTNSERLRPILG
jgi:CDP-paratose 2-epimerase